MNIAINTSITPCSNYVLFIDVPYRFSLRHFSIAFEQESLRPLTNRACHALIGTLLLLPLINLVIAAVERYLFPPAVYTQRQAEDRLRTDIPQSLYLIPIPKNKDIFDCVKVPPLPQATPKTSIPSPEKHLRASLSALKAAWRANPYTIANHNELRPPSNPYSKFEDFNIFRDALVKGNETQVRRLIQDPYFRGLNSNYSFPIQSESQTTTHLWPPLVIAAYQKQLSIFTMLLQNPATNFEPCSFNSTDYPSPLITICTFGKGHEAFIDQLIRKGASPFLRKWETNSEISALELAQKANIAQETLSRLEEWHHLNQTDQQGNNALQQAVNQCDLSAFKLALERGVCLNNYNCSGKTALHLAISQLTSAQAAIAKEMITLLLDKGAQLNLQDQSGTTPLLYLVCSKPLGWEELAIAFLKQGADPDISSNEKLFVSKLLFTYPSCHPVKAYLLNRPDGLHFHYQNQFSLATILGSFIDVDIGRNWAMANGWNFSEVIYELLPDIVNQFLNENTSDIEIQEMLSSTKKATALAKEICFMSDRAEIIKKIQAVEHPILIASGWVGHAVSLTIYQNRLICANVGERPSAIEGGLRNYQIDTNPFQQVSFPDLIQHDMQQSSISNGMEYYSLLQDLGCQYLTTLVLPDQPIDNCTWESSARLGLRAVLEIQNRWESERITLVIEKFTQFTQSFVIFKMLNYFKENISKLPLPLHSRCLTSSAVWLCKQIQESKDLFGYYKKALDAITFSGFPLYEFFFSADLIDFYTNLYLIPKHVFKETLLQELHQVGNWISC